MISRLFAPALFLFAAMSAVDTHSQCCDYKLIMQDSYGDGWDGASLEVLVNNVSVGVFTATGFGTTVNIAVCTGDMVDLVYFPAQYENEHSYVFQDASYNVVHMAGPFPPAGNVFSGAADCDTPPLGGSHPCLAFPLESFGCVTANNTGYPGSGVSINCANYQGGDIWYKIEIPPSGSLSIETLAGTMNDTGIAAWTGTDCNSLSAVGCDDDGGEGYLSFLLVYDLTPGDTLYIQAWRWGGGSGTFELCVTPIENVAFESSELPIVLINTLGQTIIEDTKIDCLMDIKYNGPGNLTFVNDAPNEYSGHVGIEIRGLTSASYPQRPYGFETRDALGANNNVPLLGMPEENDWVLISNFNDRSLLKNLMAYKIFGEMGNYSPRGQLCEVMVNESYQGIYLIGEKIKRDPNRVNIAALNPFETSGDDLTGGYILQQNYWNNNNSFQSNYSPIDHPGFDVHFVYEYPKASNIVPEQKAYIAAFIDSLETALYSDDFADPVLGFRKYMDVESFIDYFLVNEVSRNADGFKKSVFFHKDKNTNGGKLRAGPVWDFDWAWKDMAICPYFQQNGGSGWAHHVNDCFTDNYSTGWYIRMLQDTTFANQLRCRYEEYRQTMLDTANLFAYMDGMEQLLQNAQQRHFTKWPLLGVSGQAPDFGPVAETYAAELDTMKNWITQRLQWLDANIPGQCPPVINGVDETALTNSFQCFPNPAGNNTGLTIKFYLPTGTGYQLKLTNAIGTTVWSSGTSAAIPGYQSVQPDIKSLAPGLYFIRLETDEERLTHKVIIGG